VNAADAAAQLGETGAAIVAGVERCLPRWAELQVQRIVDAWGQLDPDERARVRADGHAAGLSAAARISGELRAFFAAPVEEQRTTPLQIVRSAYREPTSVLAAVQVPPVVRDEFDERAWPDDRYGLVPRTLGDLGDEDLAPLLLAWGLAKAAALRG